MNKGYALDKTNAKMLGVCAGLARSSDTDANAVRVIAVILTLCIGPIAILLYLLTALVASSR